MDYSIVKIFLNSVFQKPNRGYVWFVYGARVSLSWEKNVIHGIVSQPNLWAYKANGEWIWNTKRLINQKGFSINIKVKLVTFFVILIIFLNGV